LVWGFKGREEERGGVVRCAKERDHAERVTRSEEGDKDEQIPFRWRKKKWAGLGLRKKEKRVKEDRKVLEDFQNRFLTTFSKPDLCFKQISSLSKYFSSLSFN
jgi:hypothetical protein